jgi:hypothetical protein
LLNGTGRRSAHAIQNRTTAAISTKEHKAKNGAATGKSSARTSKQKGKIRTGNRERSGGRAIKGCHSSLCSLCFEGDANNPSLHTKNWWLKKDRAKQSHMQRVTEEIGELRVLE